MPERRETPRRAKPRRPARTPKRRPSDDTDWSEGERIAKYLARAGIASRREAEAMIERGEIRIDGRKLTTPAFKVTGREDIRVNGKRVRSPETVRLWRYHKPAGLITTTSDPKGRRTIFEELPKALPRTMTVGRLDLTTEGLLLLTNDGGLARALELPETGLKRHYRARVHGEVTGEAVEQLKNGITLADGQTYAPIIASVERTMGANSWVDVSLSEGKNREIRNAFEHLDLMVNRLIRTGYGPFSLGELKPGAVEEIPAGEICKLLKGHVPDTCLPLEATKRPHSTRPNKRAPKPPR
ncbi:MAG: pseudouridine synthase [Pseudomonadota bacterium]